jgi:hypothetical protein
VPSTKKHELWTKNHSIEYKRTTAAGKVVVPSAPPPRERRWTHMKLRAIQLAIVVASAILFAATNGSGPWP